MKNLKLSKKLLSAFGSITGLMLVLAVFSSLAMVSLSGMLTNFYDEAFLAVKYADEIDISMNEASKNMLHASMSIDKAEIDEKLARAEECITLIEADLAELEKIYKGDPVDIINVQAYFGDIKTAFATYKESGIDQAFDLYKSTILPLMDAMHIHLKNIQAHESANAEALVQSGSSSTTMTMIVVVAIGVVSIVAGFILAMAITRSIVGAVKQVEKAAQKMSDGDFNTEISYISKDEIGDLAESMRRLSSRTNAVLANLDTVLGSYADGKLYAEVNEELYIGRFDSIRVSMDSLKDHEPVYDHLPHAQGEAG